MKEPQASQYNAFLRSKKGEREAFDQLLIEFNQELQTYVRSRIGAHLKSHIDDQDILQETSAVAWKSISKLQWTGPDTMIRWLKGIARHAILRQVDSHRRRRLIFLEDDLQNVDPTPSRKLQRQERFDRLKKALDSLPDDYREAILLVRIDGMKIKDAAKEMQKSPKAVVHLLSRGLKKLKSIFGETESLNLPSLSLNDGSDSDG